MILWLPSTYCLVHSHNDDEAQTLPHAGTLGLLFLATRTGSRSLCFGIALALRGVHRLASSASWRVLLSHRLEPKLRCMRSICYRRQGSRSETLFLVLSKVHKVTPCFMYMIAHDIVHHRSDCDTNELDEASRSVRTACRIARTIPLTHRSSLCICIYIYVLIQTNGYIIIYIYM